MNRALGAALLLSLAIGCARGGDMPLNRVAMRESHPRTIALVRGNTPSPGFPRFFRLCSDARRTYPCADVAGWVNSARSNELANNSGIADPSIEIAETLMAALSKKYSLARMEGVTIRAPVTVAELSKPDYPQADLILAVGTLGWGFGPIGRGQSHVSYRGTIGLIDMRSKAVVARATCTYNPLPNDDDPQYDDVIANDFALLKGWLHQAAETCSDDYRLRILGIYGSAAR